MNWNVLGMDKLNCWKVYVALVASIVYRVRKVFTVILDGICLTQCRDCLQCFDPVTSLIVNVDM
jgi:hypothetical protein